MALLLDEPRWKQVCFAWNVSEAWESFLLLSCGALMLSTQWEPAKSVTLRDAAQAMAAAPEGWPLLAGQAAVILCFWIDVALKLAYMGWRKWWTKKWQRVYFATIVLLTVDVVAGAAAGQRPFRWLRPLLLLLRNREQRRIATALLHLLRVQLGAALAFATLLLVALPSILGLRIAPTAARHPTRAACIFASADELEDPSLASADDMECEARVVTELKDTVNNASLPDRFMMAVRAIRGEFSPSDETADTENAEDAITSALINFPAKVRLKIVSTPLGTAGEAEALGADLSLLCKQLEGAGEPELCSVERGSRRSYELILDVPDAAAYCVSFG